MAVPLIVHPLATEVSPETLRGGVVVVIDLLRATTTLCHARAACAMEIFPVVGTDDAMQLARQLTAENPDRYPPGMIRLGGERRCLPIPGFDFGNSPRDYTSESVGGRTLIFSTTNGTRAIRQASAAKLILCGALVNLEAVARAALNAMAEMWKNRDDSAVVHLLCAGAGGIFSDDDWWCAGAIAEKLVRLATDAVKVTGPPDSALPSSSGSSSGSLSVSWLEAESTHDCRREWNERFGAFTSVGNIHTASVSDGTVGNPLQNAIIAALRDTVAGRLLIDAGLEHDLDDVTRINHLDTVPAPDPVTGVIR